MENKPASEFETHLDPVVIRQVVAALSKNGIDAKPLFEGMGFEETDLHDPNFVVSYSQIAGVVRRAIELLSEPQLGLKLGAHANLVSLGIGLVGIMASNDSRQMLRYAIDFLPSTGLLLDLSLSESQTSLTLTATPFFDDPIVSRFLIEKTFALLVRLCKSVVDPSYAPTSIGLNSPQPLHLCTYEEALDCVPQFHQPINTIQFPRTTQKIKTADAAIASRMRILLGGEARGSRSHLLETTIMQALRRSPVATPTIQEVAQSMHLSERTLRRRLTQAELSYAALVDRERRDRTLRLLHFEHGTLATIAESAGFSDVRSLRRAVRRWTGKTLRDFKRRAPSSNSNEESPAPVIVQQAIASLQEHLVHALKHLELESVDTATMMLAREFRVLQRQVGQLKAILVDRPSSHVF